MFFLVFVFYKAVFYFIASSVKLHCFELLDLQMYSRVLSYHFKRLIWRFKEYRPEVRGTAERGIKKAPFHWK